MQNFNILFHISTFNIYLHFKNYTTRVKKILLFIFFSQILFSQQWSISFAERSALIALYNSTSGEQWSQKWDLEKDPKYWYGVKIKNANVVEINLRGNALKGNFPLQVSQFPKLAKLDLSNNQLSGELSPVVSSMSGLTRLDVSNNRFSGNPTATLIPLSNLTDLSIGNNLFEIPDIETFLQNFPKLEVLDLSGLNLTSVPQKISSMQKLQALNLSNNAITQNFRFLSHLLFLSELRISGNGLTKIPDELSALQNLKILDVSNNHFSNNYAGALNGLKNLEWLSLQSNQIATFPAELGQLTKLVHLNFADNKISDGFQSLRVLSNLEQIYLDKNQITSFPETLLQLRRLQMLSLTNNYISGEVPTNIPALTFLDNNRFTKQQIRDFLIKDIALADFTYSPQRYDEYKQVFAGIGGNANLTQSLSGPDYQFTWFKNLDQSLPVKSENYFISNVQQEHFAKYTCEAYALEKLLTNYLEISFFREPIELIDQLSTAETPHGLIIYPNPTSDFLNIRTTKLDVENVFIYDLSGKLILTENSQRINVAHLPSATYIITIKTSDGSKSFKFIKH